MNRIAKPIHDYPHQQNLAPATATVLLSRRRRRYSRWKNRKFDHRPATPKHPNWCTFKYITHCAKCHHSLLGGFSSAQGPSVDPGDWNVPPPLKICRRGQSMSHSFIENCGWITLQVSHHQGWKTCIKLIFRGAYRLPGCWVLEIIGVGCNLKQFDGLT